MQPFPPLRTVLHPAPKTSGVLQHGAFTMIEILVVLGIVSVLTTLMFSTVQVFVKKRDNVKCIANLKTLGQAIFAYAADNKGKSVTAYLPPEMDGGRTDTVWYLKLNTGGYLYKGYEKIVTCPSWPIRGSPNAMYAYGLRRRSEESKKYDPAWTIGSIKNPSHYVLLADSHKQISNYRNQFYYITHDNFSVPEKIHARHNRHANIFFGDGSVRSLDKNGILALEDGWISGAILTEE